MTEVDVKISEVREEWNQQITDPFTQVYLKDLSIVARQIAGEMILVPIRQNVGDL